MPMKVRRPVVADLGPERDARSICSRVFLLLNVCRQNCSHRKRRSCTYRIWNSPFANVRTICGSLMVVAMDGPTHTHWLAAQREVLARSLGGIARVTIAETPAVSTPSDKKPRKAKAVSKAKGKRRAA